MRHLSTRFLAAFCLFSLACISPIASAQSVWQKMKDAAKVQACKNGDQKACQDIAKTNQASKGGQPPQGQPLPQQQVTQPGQTSSTPQQAAEPWTPPADDSAPNSAPVRLDPMKMPDVVGVRLGMTAQEALAVSHKTYPGDLYQPTIVNWWPSAEKPNYGYNVLSRQPGNNKDVVLSFTAPPGAQQVWKIERMTQRMHINRNTLLAALREKYGKETIAFTNYQSGAVATSDAGIGQLIWLYDERGARVPLPPITVINMQSMGIQACVQAGGIGEPIMPKDGDWGKNYSEWCAHHLVALAVTISNMDIVETATTTMEDIPLAMRTSHAAAAWLREVAQKQHQQDLEKSKENKPTL